MQALRMFGLAALLAAGLGAQGRIGGPVAGFVYDGAAGRLRPVLGIPGASLLGDAVDSGYELKFAVVAPQQDAAVAIAADGAAHFLRLNAGAVEERVTDGLAVTAERVVFSPSGTAAALYAAGTVQAIVGLPGAPARGAAFDLSAYGTPGSLALSDDGNYLLFAARGSIRLMSSAGDDRALLDAADGALAAFAPASHDAAVVDAAGAGVTILRDAAGNAERQAVAAADGSIASPAGLAFSADGNKLFVASAGARGVSLFDLAAGTRNDLACDCTPSGLARMGNLFRLNEAGAGPLWLVDARAAEPRLVFVPALRAE